MKLFKLLALISCLLAISACTPVFISKATTIMDGRCTDLEGCTGNPYVPACHL